MRAALFQGDHLARDIVQLTYDDPGRQDSAYQSRRDQIAAVARSFDRGEPVPEIDYTGAEHRVWRARSCAASRPAFRRRAFTPSSTRACSPRQVAHVGAQAHRTAPCEATRAYEGGR
ncbi:hypothetical protein WMF38_19180 [Sorangium sp. So ce118]